MLLLMLVIPLRVPSPVCGSVPIPEVNRLVDVVESGRQLSGLEAVELGGVGYVYVGASRGGLEVGET